MDRIGAGVCGLTWVVMVSGCDPTPISRATIIPVASAVAPTKTVVILPPLVTFQRIEDESPLPAADYKADDIETSLLTAATKSLSSHNSSLIDCSRVAPAEVTEICRELGRYAPQLARGAVREDARPLLHRLAGNIGGATVLAHSLLGKVGPGAYWDPNTGAIRSGISSSVLRAALIDSENGQVLLLAAA